MHDTIVQFDFMLPFVDTDSATRAHALHDKSADTAYVGFTANLFGTSPSLRLVSDSNGCEILHLAEFLTELAYSGLIDDMVGFVFSTGSPGDDSSGVAVFEPAICAFSVTTVSELIDRMKHHAGSISSLDGEETVDEFSRGSL